MPGYQLISQYSINSNVPLSGNSIFTQPQWVSNSNLTWVKNGTGIAQDDLIANFGGAYVTCLHLATRQGYACEAILKDDYKYPQEYQDWGLAFIAQMITTITGGGFTSAHNSVGGISVCFQSADYSALREFRLSVTTNGNPPYYLTVESYNKDLQGFVNYIQKPLSTVNPYIAIAIKNGVIYFYASDPTQPGYTPPFFKAEIPSISLSSVYFKIFMDLEGTDTAMGGAWPQGYPNGFSGVFNLMYYQPSISIISPIWSLTDRYGYYCQQSLIALTPPTPIFGLRYYTQYLWQLSEYLINNRMVKPRYLIIKTKSGRVSLTMQDETRIIPAHSIEKIDLTLDDTIAKIAPIDDDCIVIFSEK